MTKKRNNKHTFVVCAYGNSPYLEMCIQSLLEQTVKSDIVIATSTPNKNIIYLAQKYNLELCVNHGEKGIAGDWNFALSLPKTQLITLAHQDDIYMPEYVNEILKAYLMNKEPIIIFTNYHELREDITVKTNTLLKVKRTLLLPLKSRKLCESRFIRRRILSLGNTICCPSVAFAREKIEIPLFRNNMKSNIDWQAWEELSKKKGTFIYLKEPLVKHRIHEDSTTSHLLAQAARRQEDIFMFRKFWPGWMAEFIEFFYCKNEKSNNLDSKRR